MTATTREPLLENLDECQRVIMVYQLPGETFLPQEFRPKNLRPAKQLPPAKAGKGRLIQSQTNYHCSLNMVSLLEHLMMDKRTMFNYARILGYRDNRLNCHVFRMALKREANNFDGNVEDANYTMAEAQQFGRELEQLHGPVNIWLNPDPFPRRGENGKMHDKMLVITMEVQTRSLNPAPAIVTIENNALFLNR